MANRKIVPVDQARKEGKPMAANENEIKFTKVIVTDDKGDKYTLEFNSRVVKNMERRGFKVDLDTPNNMIDDLFLGALQMHHKGIAPERAKAVWQCQRGKEKLLGVLTQLYMKPLEDLMAEPEGEGDPTWETV